MRCRECLDGGGFRRGRDFSYPCSITDFCGFVIGVSVGSLISTPHPEARRPGCEVRPLSSARRAVRMR